MYAIIGYSAWPIYQTNVSQSLQTSQLPENDRTSISLKEYLADIDVCMGGRVAEQLGEFISTALGDLFIRLVFRLRLSVRVWERD
jgi:ATP-dependent Zn proteases